MEKCDCEIISRHPELVAMVEEDIERRKTNHRTAKGKKREETQ